MKNLTVRNNWESLEWSFGGRRIDPIGVHTIVINGVSCNARPKRVFRSYNDHGHQHSVETFDIEIEVDVLLVPEKLWLSLAQHEALRAGVTSVRGGRL